MTVHKIPHRPGRHHEPESIHGAATAAKAQGFDGVEFSIDDTLKIADVWWADKQKIKYLEKLLVRMCKA